jgi:3',5'-cyclic AMP phosphodiesterase CpdA
MGKTRYFVVITDPHIVEPNRTLYGLDTNTATKHLIARVKEEVVDLAGVICLGDLADTVLNPDRMTAIAGHEAYTHARELLGELGLPILTLAGNHDDPEIMQQYFPNRWESSQDGVRIFHCFGVDLIGIDVRTGPEPTGLATANCLRALDQALAKSSKALLFSHYPLFDLDNSRIDDELSTINRREVHETIAPHRSKIQAAFHGHLHLWITALASGIVSYGVPSSSFIFVLEPQSAQKEVVGPSPCGYLLLGIGDDGSVIVRPRFLPAAK